MLRSRVFVTLAAVLALGACSQYASCGSAAPVAGGPEAAAGPADAALGLTVPGRTVIAFLGDSLTAGLGLASQDAFPGQIQNMFAAEGYGEVEVINGGVSGDTTAGGLRRVDQLLGPDTRILVVGLGGNDALRGLTVAQTYENLSAIIEQGLTAGVSVVVAGMLAPTNLGEDYRTAFRDVYARLSQDYDGAIVFVPFLLEGVAGDPALNQRDGIHPTAAGARVIAEHLYPTLRDIVDQLPPGLG